MSKSAALRKSEKGTYHHGDLRKSLIQAALELAAESKDWNFSLREVARRAGVSHNAPYNHFTKKKELVAAAALAGHDLLRHEIGLAVANAKDPCTAIHRAGSAYVQFGIQNAALYQLMFTASLNGPDWRPDIVVAAGEETRALVEQVLRAGAGCGSFASTLTRKTELQAASLFAWAVVHGFTMIAISRLTNMEPISIDRLTSTIMSMVLEALGSKNAALRTERNEDSDPCMSLIKQ